jgi:hypothetical protein
MWQDQFPLVKNLLDQSQSTVVLLGPQPKREYVAAALALTSIIQNMGKHVTLVSAADQAGREDLADIPNLEILKSEMGNKDLDISFDYVESAVDKVSYHIDDAQKKFHLVIQPKRGFSPLDTASVQFHLTGAAADLIITIGIDNGEQVQNVYDEYQDIFDTANIIAIHSYESTFGTVKISSAGLSSVAELVAMMCQALSEQLSATESTQLLIALDAAPNGLLSPMLTADSFELIAKLLRAGGQRPQPKVLPTRQPEVRLVGSGSTTQNSTHGFAEMLGKRNGLGKRVSSQDNDEVASEKKKKVKTADKSFSHGEGSRGG